MVLDILRECGSLLEGHFLFSSGLHSARYCQCAMLQQDPQKLEKVLELVAQQVKDLGATAVIGPAMGGIVASYELARQLGVRAMFTERGDDGIMALRRGFTLSPGEKVLIAEDVVTTGKSTKEALAAIEEYDVEIVGLCCIVDRRAKDIEMPYPLYSATRLEAVAYAPDACPICGTGLPLVKPGSRKMV